MPKTRFEYKFTAIYILLGGTWIIFSDELLAYFIKDPGLLTTFQTYKGWFYVLITSLLFYYILKGHIGKLRAAENKARESDLLKTAFLRNISHEIRTPMNSIIGFSTLLNENNLPDVKKTEYLQIINNSSHQLLNIVNEILDISLIETGNIYVVDRKANVNMLLDEIFDYFNPLMKKNIILKPVKGLNNERSNVITDEPKIRKILTNLIDNSLKFTEKGQISFGYVAEENELVFFVEDTGIGIPDKFKPNLFTRFQKAEYDPSRLYEGLGLGLSICKGYIDLLNGKIWMESSPGKGSKFYFTTPYKPVPDNYSGK
jgi:signal transduction histidine kinase